MRAEVTANANCTGTRLLDGLRGYPVGRGHVGHYSVEAAAHHYIFGNTQRVVAPQRRMRDQRSREVEGQLPTLANAVISW